MKKLTYACMSCIVVIFSIVLAGSFSLALSAIPHQALQLSEDQDFVVTDNALVGETIGRVKAYPKFHKVYGTPSFAKTGSDTVFDLQPEGMITLARPDLLTSGTLTFNVTVSLEGFTDTEITVSVKVLDSSKTIFVDPSQVGDGTGTRLSPRNTWPTPLSNTNILFKRGTTISRDYEYMLNNIDNILIGAYGTGPKPVLEMGNDELFRVYNGCFNPVIRDLEYTSREPARSNPDPNYANWANALVYSSSVEGTMRVINCESHHSHNGMNSNSSGAGFAPDQNVEFKWNYIHDVAQEGMYLQEISGVGEASANTIERINLLWSYTEDQQISSGDGIQTLNVHTFYARNNYIDKSYTGNKFCIIHQYDKYTPLGDEDAEITGNYFIGNAGGINNSVSGAAIFADFMTGIISGNVFIGNKRSRAISRGPYADNITVSYNLFKHHGEVLVFGCPTSNIYNNVFYDSDLILYSPTTNFVNNIIYFDRPDQVVYNSLTPIVRSDYNLFNREQANMFGGVHNLAGVQPAREMNSIVSDPLFINSAADDFRLFDQSRAIDNGTDVGLMKDFYSNPLVATPDIGLAEGGFGVKTDAPFCFPIKTKTGSVTMICL